MRGIVEEVRDLDEFKEVVNEEYKIHYESFWNPIIHKKRHIVKCVLVNSISWNDKKLKEYMRTTTSG